MVAIFFAIIAFGQNQPTSEKKVRFGIKAGVTVAKTQFENKWNPTDYSFKTGGFFGVFIRKSLNKSVYFQPELLLVNKGAKEKHEDYNYRVDLTYLELPLNLLYKSSDSKGGFFIGGGPAPSVFIGDNIFYFGDQNAKSFDFGINILTGYELPIGFSINLNYTHGLLNLTSDKEHVPTIRNRSFGLTLGYLFR